MSERFSAQEVGLLIRARQILKDKGLDKDIDVKGICEAAGVSRKTGYQWAKSLEISEKQEHPLGDEMVRLKAECEDFKKRCLHLEAINEGHQLAWEIHGVEELLAAKKNTITRQKGEKP
jgi:hypothetical protein